MSAWRIKPAGSGNWWHLEKRVLGIFWRYENSSSSIESLVGIVKHLNSTITIIYTKPNRIVESA